MYNPAIDMSLWAFLLTYLLAFGISSLVWSAVDFSKFIKKEESRQAILVFWFLVTISSYLLAHILFDFINAIGNSIN